MGAAIRRAEAGRRHVRIDLGRREALVAEQLLDDAQVRAALEEVRRERVAEGGWRDAGGGAPPPPGENEARAEAAPAARPPPAGQGELPPGGVVTGCPGA